MMKIKHFERGKGAGIEEGRKTERNVLTLKCMVQIFWEYWRWEVDKPKEALFASPRIGYQMFPKNNGISKIPEIQPDHLVSID